MRWLQLAMAAVAVFSLALFSIPQADASLLAYYPFDENANDASSNGYNGTVNGATLSSTGYYGKSYYFYDDYIRINLDINPSNYPQLTMGAWVNTDLHTAIQNVISHDNGNYDRSLGTDWRGGGTAYWEYWSAFSGSGDVLGGESVGTDTWTFIAVSYDETRSLVTLYVNGNTYTETGSLLAGPNSGLSYTDIGRNPTYGHYFRGYIDEVFFFDNYLTKAQLDSIRLNGVHDVPEPMTFILVGIGLAGLIRMRRKFH